MKKKKQKNTRKVALVTDDCLPHNYIPKWIAFAKESGLEPGTYEFLTSHDDWCAYFKGGACNCDPDVELLPDGPTGRN